MKETALATAIRAPRELTLTRVFNVPREIVFKAWTDPKQVTEWWGPKQFTNPRCEWNARVGGSIRVDMRSPEGNDHPMGGTFREVVPFERLVFTTTAFFKGEKKPFLENLNVITFEDLDGRTKMTVHVTVLDAAPEAEGPLSGMREGWSMSLDKLAELIEPSGNASADNSDREISITRLFDAPRELVWKVWTDPKHIALWWGPKGFSNTIQTMDVTPGGEWRFIMHGPDGVDYPNKATYREVKRPERLFYDHGEPGELSYFQVTVTFEEVKGKTKLSMKMLFPTAELRNAVAEKYGAVEGLKQNMDKLAEYLATHPKA